MDFDKYNFTKNANTEWLTDTRHVRIIHEFLMSNDFSDVMEIGSYTGLSTSAFIEALNKGKDFTLHISEPNITSELLALIGMCNKPEKIIINTDDGYSMLKKRPEAEFVFIDGDHSIQGAGIETLQLLRNKTPNIMAHDINLEQCQMACSGKGSELMGRVFASHRDYYYIEDKKKRDGERTERGFMFATTSKENYNIGTRIFKQIC